MNDSAQIKKNIKNNTLTGIFLVSLLGAVFILGCSNANSVDEGRIWPSVALSPDGQDVLLSIYHAENRNIYRIGRKDKTVARLTSTRGSDIDPQYSPDGSKIIFSSAPSATYGAAHNLYMMTADGSSKTQLTSGLSHDFAPVFSPDGKRIYFIRAQWFGAYSAIASSHWHDMNLYSMDVDGANLKQMTSGKYYDISPPSISPYGKEIMVRLQPGGGRPIVIATFSVESPSTIKSIIPDMHEYLSGRKKDPSDFYFMSDFYRPQFSPDGKTMIFEWVGNDEGYYEYEIYLMDLKSRNVKKITNLKSHVEAGSFSSNGKEIVFLSDPKRNRSFELWTINSDGTNLQRIDIPLLKA